MRSLSFNRKIKIILYLLLLCLTIQLCQAVRKSVPQSCVLVVPGAYIFFSKSYLGSKEGIWLLVSRLYFCNPLMNTPLLQIMPYIIWNAIIYVISKFMGLLHSIKAVALRIYSKDGLGNICYAIKVSGQILFPSTHLHLEYHLVCWVHLFI